MGQLQDIGKESYMMEQGYEWVEKYESFVNHEKWKVFTRNYLEDHSFDEICASLEQAPTEGRWQVYTSTESEADIHNIHKHYGSTS